MPVVPDDTGVPKSWNEFGPPQGDGIPTLSRGADGEGLGGSGPGSSTPPLSSEPPASSTGHLAPSAEPPDPLIHRSDHNYNPQTFAQCTASKGFPTDPDAFANVTAATNTLLKIAVTVLGETALTLLGGEVDEVAEAVAGGVAGTYATLIETASGASTEATSALADSLSTMASTGVKAGNAGQDFKEGVEALHNIPQLMAWFTCAVSSGLDAATIPYNEVMEALGKMTGLLPTPPSVAPPPPLTAPTPPPVTPGPPPLTPVAKAGMSVVAKVGMIAGAVAIAAAAFAIIASNSNPGPTPTPPIQASYYLHWSCQGVGQCEQVMGGAYGVALGPVSDPTCVADENSVGIQDTWCSPDPNPSNSR
jgi:hypothetical protein